MHTKKQHSYTYILWTNSTRILAALVRKIRLLGVHRRYDRIYWAENVRVNHRKTRVTLSKKYGNKKIDDLAKKNTSLDNESPKDIKGKFKINVADLQNEITDIDERIKQIEVKIKNYEKLCITIKIFSNSLNLLINILEKK